MIKFNFIFFKHFFLTLSCVFSLNFSKKNMLTNTQIKLIVIISNHQFVFILSFMIKILFLLNLTSEVVSTVYQFLKFAESDNLLIKKIFQNCSNLFDFITSHYSKLSFSQELLQFSSSIKQREHSASSDSLSSF